MFETDIEITCVHPYGESIFFFKMTVDVHYNRFYASFTVTLYASEFSLFHDFISHSIGSVNNSRNNKMSEGCCVNLYVCMAMYEGCKIL